MSEKMRESLSALMDNEANELELQRILAKINEDDELRQTWMRYNAARDALDPHASSAFMNLDISRQVQAAIGDETPDTAESVEPAAGLRERLLRPVASFAVAASVAATAVIGGQQLTQVSSESADPGSAIANAVSVPYGNSGNFGARPVTASYGLGYGFEQPELQPPVRSAYQELARHKTNRHIQEHAEHSALNSPHGLVPYARVPQIKE